MNRLMKQIRSVSLHYCTPRRRINVLLAIPDALLHLFPSPLMHGRDGISSGTLDQVEKEFVHPDLIDNDFTNTNDDEISSIGGSRKIEQFDQNQQINP